MANDFRPIGRRGRLHRRLPEPRGPLSGGLIDVLRGSPRRMTLPAADVSAAALYDEDLQLALYVAYVTWIRRWPEMALAVRAHGVELRVETLNLPCTDGETYVVAINGCRCRRPLTKVGGKLIFACAALLRGNPDGYPYRSGPEVLRRQTRPARAAGAESPPGRLAPSRTMDAR